MPAESLLYARQDPASLWAARQMGLKALDSVNDVRAINEYLEKNETPWDKSTREAREQTAAIAKQMEDLTANFNETIRTQAEQNRLKIEQVTSDLTAGFDQRISDLMVGMDAERNRFNDQFGALQTQYQRQTQAFNDLNLQYNTLNEANAEQQRLAANSARGNVPMPVASAELPLSGDQRESMSDRKGKDNNLSNLTVLSGLSSADGNETGLQLA